MATRLTLICHAATEATRLARFPVDEDLEPGCVAALAAGESPTPGSWLTAPERRSRQTALCLAAREVDVEPALRDWDLGVWAGRTLRDVAATDADGLARWLANPEAAPHGGETLEALLARVAEVMETAAGRGGRVVGVTHPAAVRAAVVTALGAGSGAFWRIDAPPLARARLSHDGRRWVLQALTPADAGSTSATHRGGFEPHV